MGRRRNVPRRSAAEWGIRLWLAALAVFLGYLSINQTYAYSTRNKHPERAYALAPRDGRIAGALAQRVTGVEATMADFVRAKGIARDALLHDPTAVTAASTLGIIAQIDGDNAGARRLFAYSEHLSRRDLRTQLWAIEDAVARQDVDGALRHYDIALRASPNSSGILFPILASAITDPTIRAALARTLDAKPGWAPLFVEYASAKSPDPKSTSLLFQSLRRAGIPISEMSQSLLVDALMSHGLHEEAWTYYASYHRGVDRLRSRDVFFDANLANPTLFDWQVVGTEGASASIQRLGKGGVLDFSAPATVGGALARQVQLLPPGSYRLAGHSNGIDQAGGTNPYWVLSCQSGRELGRVEIPNSSQAHGNFSGRFDVPQDCQVQNLTLVARPTDAIGGVAGQIDRIELLPLR